MRESTPLFGRVSQGYLWPHGPYNPYPEKMSKMSLSEICCEYSINDQQFKKLFMVCTHIP